MKVSVVIPTFNRRELVLRSVGELSRQDFPCDQYEIIVVVDGSSDGSGATLRDKALSVPYRVLEQENRGLAEARNTGWRNATGEIVLFLDDDMFPHRGLVKAHWEAHVGRSNLIGVGSVVLDPECTKTLATECFNREVGAYALAGRENLTPLPLAACIFGNTSLRRRWLEETSGFDGRYRMREDAELAVRLGRLGVCPFFIRDALAYQTYLKNAVDLIRDAEAFAESDVLFLRQHPEAKDLTFAGRISQEASWKRIVHSLLARLPGLSETLCLPWEMLGEWFPDHAWFLDAGVRALQIRRASRYYRRVLAIEPGPAPGTGEEK